MPATTTTPPPPPPPPPSETGDPDRPVHIVFVGAGAVGCFYASRLHHPKHNLHVSLIARSNYAALAQDGVKLQTHSFGDYTFRPHAVFPSVTAAAAATTTTTTTTSQETGTAAAAVTIPAWDFIIVTTKALPDRTDDAATIAPLVGPTSTVVLIQNGVGVESPYRTRFPSTPIVSAVTVVSAAQVSPGTIRQHRWTRIHLGPYTNSASTDNNIAVTSSSSSSSPSLGSSNSNSNSNISNHLALGRRGAVATAQLSDWWGRLGGIRDAEPLDETGLQTVRWHKLCINAAFNPSAVLAGGRGNADMARDPDLRRHLAGVMDEIWDAAPRVLGRPFPDDLARPDRILASSERNVGSKPSMLLDWEGRRPLELEVILGNPVRIAQDRGVELPRLQTLYALLKSAQAMRDREKKEKL